MLTIYNNFKLIQIKAIFMWGRTLGVRPGEAFMTPSSPHGSDGKDLSKVLLQASRAAGLEPSGSAFSPRAFFLQHAAINRCLHREGNDPKGEFSVRWCTLATKAPAKATTDPQVNLPQRSITVPRLQNHNLWLVVKTGLCGSLPSAWKMRPSNLERRWKWDSDL